MKKIIVIFTIAAIAVPAALYLKSQKEVVASLPIAKVRHYSVATVKTQTKSLQETRNFLAQLLASKSALVTSKYSAKILKTYVQENDTVKKGELLVALDDREIQANIDSLVKQKNSLTLDVENVKRSLERNQKLLKAQAISQEKYDNTNVLYQTKLSKLQAIQESIKQAKVQMSYLNIKAPFSGRVGTIFVDAGNLAVPGKPILSLNSDDQKLIFSYAPTEKLIADGASVLIDSQKIGEVTKKYGDAKNALLVAEVKLDKALPYANQSFVNIEVVTAQLKGCVLPLNALLHRKNGTFIMIYKEQKFQSMPVKVLLQNSTEAIIKECPTDMVATASEAKLALLPSLGEVVVTQEK